MVHSAESYGNMMKPVGSNIDEIYVRSLAELHIAGVAIIDSSFGELCLLQKLLAILSAIFLMVADSYDLHTGNIHPASYST
jgi:ABC-type uncharacterized transport system permease subunit